MRPESGRYGRSRRHWEYLRFSYKVEGLVDRLVRGGSSPLGRIEKSPAKRGLEYRGPFRCRRAFVSLLRQLRTISEHLLAGPTPIAAAGFETATARPQLESRGASLRSSSHDADTIVGVLPELDVTLVRDFCAQRVPTEAADELRIELVEGRGSLTIVERRAPWRADLGPDWSSLDVARLRYAADTGHWTLFGRGSDEQWHRYGPSEPSSDIRPLLDEIDRDPTGIFWG